MCLKISVMQSFSRTSLYFLEPVPLEGESNKMHIKKNTNQEMLNATWRQMSDLGKITILHLN